MGARRITAIAGAVGVLCATALVGASPAAGTGIVSTTVTSVTKLDGTPYPSHVLLIEDDDNYKFDGMKISGTSTSSGSGTDTQLQVRCYYDDATAASYVQLGNNVTPSASGAWTTYASPYYLYERHCKIRAVPKTYAGTDFSAFPALPTVYSGLWFEIDHTGYDTAFNNAPYEWYAYGYLSSTYFYAYNSSSDGISEDRLSTVTGTNLESRGHSIWSDVAATYYNNSASGPQAARASFVVDGHPAYDGYQAYDEINEDASGSSGLSVAVAMDPATGALVVSESSDLVYCIDGSSAIVATLDPGSTCASFQSSGVRFTRVVTTNGTGDVSAIRDTFSSTNGAQHSADWMYVDDTNADDFKFPGQTAFAAVTANTAISTASWPQAGVEYARYLTGTPDGSASDPIGAIAYSAKPNSVVAEDTDELYQQYQRTIAAGKSTTLTRTFVTAASTTAAATAATAALAGNGPGLQVTPLPAQIGTHAVTVTGKFTAGGNGVPDTVTANGISAPVANDGTFSVVMPLAAGAGAKSVAVVGTDVTGQVASGSVTTTYANPAGAGAPKVAKTKSVAGKVTKGTVTVPVSCASFGPPTGCKVTLKLGAKGKPLAAAKTVTVAPGKTVKVVLALSGAAVGSINGLVKGKHLSGNLQTIYADPAGGTLALKVKTVKLA